MRQNDSDRLQRLSQGQGQLDELGTISGQAHLSRGKALLQAPGNASDDLYFARSALERAAVLQVDNPEPYFLAGYANFRLGNYDYAYQSFLTAARLDGQADGWWLAALAALRSRHELLAQALYSRGASAGGARSATLATYMNSLYGNGGKTVAKRDDLSEVQPFFCSASDDEIEGYGEICSSDLQVELFIVQRQAEAGSAIGQDLLADLSVGLEGSPLEFSKERTKSTTTSAGDTEASVDDSTEISRSNTITVDLPSINYALSMATDAEAVSSVSSTPILNVSLGQDANLFVGQNLHIIGADAQDNTLDEDIGIKIEIELNSFSQSAVTMHAKAELSDFVPPTLGEAFTKVEIDSSSVESGGRVPYNSAFLLGSLEMTSRTDAQGGQKGLRQIPMLGDLFGERITNLETHEVAILLTVRPPDAIKRQTEARLLEELKSFGLSIPTVARRQPIIHKTPSLAVITTELGLLP